MSQSRASLVPLAPWRQLNKLLQNLLLQVLRKIPTLWFMRPQPRQDWHPRSLRQREPLNPKTFHLVLLPSPEGKRQIKNVEKRKQPQTSTQAPRRNWILSLRGTSPLCLFNVLFLYFSLLTIHESLLLQAIFFSEWHQKHLDSLLKALIRRLTVLIEVISLLFLNSPL